MILSAERIFPKFDTVPAYSREIFHIVFPQVFVYNFTFTIHKEKFNKMRQHTKIY